VAESTSAEDDLTRLVVSWCRWYDIEDPDDQWAERDAISEFIGVGAN
jgi:hypothetical protein